MSCKSCDVKKDKKVMCPTRMSDGRAFTDYRPRCIVNAELLEKVSNKGMIKSSYESRMYLQKNADEFMKSELKKATDRLIPCAPCLRSKSEPGTMLPERYVVRCDGVTCSRTEEVSGGLGDGRNFK
jgi:hypothetical protein